MTKCFLKIAEVLSDVGGMCLPKFDIYRSTVAPNCFNSLDTKVNIILKPIN